MLIRTIVAILERSNRCAASTAVTIAPSRAEKSHSSSVTRNFFARFMKADGLFDTLTAMTCLGFSGSGNLVPSSVSPCSEISRSEPVPVVTASSVDGVGGVVGDLASLALSASDKEEMPIVVASVPTGGTGTSV